MTELVFEKLIGLHGDSIYGFCCHLTGRADEAENLYHDSVLKAFSKLKKINCDTDSESAYLSARNYIIGIAVRLARNLARKSSAGRHRIRNCNRCHIR